MVLNSQENILSVLFSYNPWWQNGTVQKEFDKPMKRDVYFDAMNVLEHQDIRRVAILCGIRRTGKTTIMYQTISELLKCNVSPKNILFVSFDHPLLKLCSINRVLEIYRSNISSDEDIYCFFDEIQYAPSWDSYLKIFYDTNPRMKIMATGSASLYLKNKITESGMGRWKIIHVPTLSFYEYCELLNIKISDLPLDLDPFQICLKSRQEQVEIFNKLSILQIPFIRYLEIGGFPELALSSDDLYARQILREDIVDKALKRDLPSIYGIRNVNDIEKVFLYLCYTSSNIINLQTLSKELEGVSRNTIEKYITYLEDMNLIYISPMANIGPRKLLKSQNKIYIADASIRNAILMRDNIINNPEDLGLIVETTIYKHIKSFYYDTNAKVGYYRGEKKHKEIDIVVQKDNVIPIMFEVKYRDQAHIKETDAIVELASSESINFVITKSANDFGEYYYDNKRIYRIPAFSFLYMLGFIENNKRKKI